MAGWGCSAPVSLASLLAMLSCDTLGTGKGGSQLAGSVAVQILLAVGGDEKGGQQEANDPSR